jgi:hypothetical protein
MMALLTGSVAQADDTPAQTAPQPALQTAPQTAPGAPAASPADTSAPNVPQTAPEAPAASAPAAPEPSVPTPPPPAAAVSAPSTAPAPPPQSAVQTVAPEDAEAVLGQRVTDPEGKDIGRLVDVLVDANGQPQAAVIDFGGFMGVGNRKIAVHWGALHFNPGDAKNKVALEMTPDQIKAAPEFRDPTKAAAVVTPADIAPQSSPPRTVPPQPSSSP